MSKTCLLYLSIFWCLASYGQRPVAGIWEGRLNAGVEMRIIFHIKDSAGTLSATMESPEQGLKNVQVSGVEFISDSIKLEIPQFQAKYAGRLTGDTMITGKFQQGLAIPVVLKKIKQVVIKIKPQTPVAPFPYKSEDVVYTSADQSIRYGATITIPVGKGPFPAVLLLTGSGQQNRDEEMVGHKPFAVIADHLTRNGFVVLRADDRGVGQTTGDVHTATTRHFADDAIVSLNYLKGRREVDKKKIGLIGHSEGAMIAQIIAAEREDIRSVVFLAGPGVEIKKLMHEQNEAVFTRAGVPNEYVTAYLELYDQLLEHIIKSDTAQLRENLTSTVNEWSAKTRANIVVATTGIKDEASKQRFIEQFLSLGKGAWFKYFLNYSPEGYLKNIRAHVLAINGSKDVQVISKTNLPAIEAALKAGKAKSYRIEEAAGLNHLFQECKTCMVNEYGQLDETFSPKILELMTTWMKKL
jgi:pimeloyl-ACP methyl ester carboxylesterase